MAKDSIILIQSDAIKRNGETVQKLNEIAEKSQKQAIKYKKQRNRWTIGGVILSIAAFFSGLLI